MKDYYLLEIDDAVAALQSKDEEIEKLHDLLKECLAHLSLGEIGTSVTPVNILLTRINAALGESEDK